MTEGCDWLVICPARLRVEAVGPWRFSWKGSAARARVFDDAFTRGIARNEEGFQALEEFYLHLLLDPATSDDAAKALHRKLMLIRNARRVVVHEVGDVSK
jgi:hypothetical protein